MRAPRPLGSRRVDDNEVEEAPWGEASRAHRRQLNLEACARVRRSMDGETGRPDVKLIVPEHGGPPSAIILDPTTIEFDPKAWDSQARSASTGRYLRLRR
jgi:hypothetical protein